MTTPVDQTLDSGYFSSFYNWSSSIAYAPVNLFHSVFSSGSAENQPAAVPLAPVAAAPAAERTSLLGREAGCCLVLSSATCCACCCDSQAANVDCCGRGALAETLSDCCLGLSYCVQIVIALGSR